MSESTDRPLTTMTYLAEARRLAGNGTREGAVIAMLLAHIDAQAEEIERLRGDVRQWMCDHCDVVYPGPPADGVWCVVCSRCGGDTAPRTVVERWRLQRELDRLSAENARLISDIKMITAPVEVGGGADAYLRAEIERLRREREAALDILSREDIGEGAKLEGVRLILKGGGGA